MTRTARGILFSTVILVWTAASGFAPAAKGEADPYGGVRIRNFPLAVQCWTFRNFSFFETLRMVRGLGVRSIQAYPGQPLGAEAPGAVFDHNLSGEMVQLVQKKLRESGIEVVGYGVVNFDNTDAAIRKVFEFARTLGIRVIVTEPQEEGAEILEKLVREYWLYIAIHNHPEPSAFAKPETVLSYVRDKDERFGSCFDNGHFMRGGHRPIECLRILKGRVWDVHLKDRSDYGTDKAEDVPLGQGRADIRSLLAELTLQDYRGWLTIEHEAEEDAANPVPAVTKCLEHIRSVTGFQDYQELLIRDISGYEKHSWNHYGPGYFDLDPKTGVLESHGGMGLLWYSGRKFKDFILELDYMCSAPETNSGIFVRVPQVPVSDDYIYHSFEIQIDDTQQGIHRTGAVYDAEAPSGEAASPAREWNHYKITFQGNRIQVELNGRRVVDWQAEPRGKVKDIAPEGYIGLQNHDGDSPVYFRNIFIKELI
ncbi:MAG: hypothetical protein A2Y56_13710 [Candidatus Aminicenantes bacterium RBG_13_63_10]|nr:MAG: hypothetical protein A2Y56_13710 [Candidatus Aminicenantes bacterium RBG_13_63_10]